MAEMAKKILIIEDDLGLARILSDILTKEQFAVSIAKDGEEGLEKAFRESPDLIFLDIQLPRMRGTVFLEQLRKDKRGTKIPVIVLSNLDDIDTVSKTLEGNVMHFFVKADMNLSDLVNKTKELLG
ncbi:MAG: response regulator [bacterium]|nr:response regulator [bacterium]